MNRTNPFEELNRIMNRMNASARGDYSQGYGPIDVRHKGDSVEVVVDVTGYNEEDVDITMENQRLTISAQRESREDTDTGFGIQNQSFSRTIILPESVAEDTATAELSNGVLVVSMDVSDSNDSGVNIKHQIV